MNMDNHQDRVDPLLASAYAALRDEPAPKVDWDAMRHAIHGRAEPILSRRKFRRVVRRSRPLVPLALAASLAYGLWIGPAYIREILTPEPVAVAADMDVEEILDQAVDDSISDQEFRLLVTGRANADELLAFAVSDR